MKIIPLDLIKNFFRDRALLGYTILVFLVGTAYVIFVALSLEPSDLQVATRYTAFGDTNLGYRNKWHYLLSYVVFGLILMGVHTALAIKLHARGMRQPAMYLLAFTVFLFVVAWILTHSVLKIAFL
jgi:hypothetical protein